MNAKAKRRAGSEANEPESVGEPETSRRPPLTAAAGAQVFDVDAAGAGERLDRFLGHAAAERRVALSRTRLKALIEAGEIWVDGAVARDPSMRLAEGATIAFEAPEAEESPLLGEDLPLDVIYEDEHLIVIDKPAGLVVHPAPGHADGTLVNALIRHCGASLSGVGGSGVRASSTGSTWTRPAFWSWPRPTPRIGALPTFSPIMAAADRSSANIWRSSGAPSTGRRAK